MLYDEARKVLSHYRFFAWQSQRSVLTYFMVYIFES